MTTGECCYVCNECPVSYATLTELEQHISEGHTGIKTEACDAEPEPEQMSLDDQDGSDQDHESNSPSSSDAASDESVDLEEKQNVYNCRFCPKVFSDRSQLNVHYTHTHRDKPQYVCEVCGIVFGVKRELSTHMRIHSGEQPHKCTQCGKEFGTRQLLKKHWMWHTGERSHVCPHCDKAFFQKGHLTQHLMIHAGGRPHRCQLCHKTFIFKFDLNRHMKIHAERGHLCSKCGRSFLKQASLEEHALKCKGSPGLARSRSSTRTSTPLMMTENTSTTLAETQIPSPQTTPASGSQPQPQLNMLNFMTPPAQISAPNFNPEEMQKLAFLLQQHRAIAALTAQNFANNQLLKGQTAFPGLPPVTNASNNFFCILCQKNFNSQVNLQLHFQFHHMKNNVFGQPPMEEPQMNAAPPTLSTSIFGQPLTGIKTEESAHIHTDSNTNSSASSPSKGSPMNNHSPTNTVSDVDDLSGRSESPDSDKPCNRCDIERRRTVELESEVSRLMSELDQTKELLRNIAGSLVESRLESSKNLLHLPIKPELLNCSNL